MTDYYFDINDRPIRYSKGEIGGFNERATWLLENAEKCLSDTNVDAGRPTGLKRIIRRQALGVTLLVGAWNVSTSPTTPSVCKYPFESS